MLHRQLWKHLPHILLLLDALRALLSMLLVRVVVGAGVLFDGAGRVAAALGLGAVGGFELDGGVVDLEAMLQGVVDFLEDRAGLGEGAVADGDVAGESVGVGGEAPDVEVVDTEDAGDLLDGGADLGDLEALGGALEEDVEGLADDAGAGPEDEAGDDEGEDGVDPGEAGEEDASASGDDGGGGEGVAEHVEEDGTDVDVAGEAPEESGDGSVHEDAEGGNDHHDVGLDGDGRVQASDGGDGDPAGEDDEGEGVDEGGEDAGALVAEGLAVVGGA